MDVLRWLLEEENPSARYLALRDLLGWPEDDPQVTAARSAIPGHPPARTILEAQWPAGYWMHPDVGYSPRHKATVWQVIFLSALGTPPIAAVDRACGYVLEHSRLPDGRFTAQAVEQRAGVDKRAAVDKMAAVDRKAAGDRATVSDRSAPAHTPARGTYLCLNGSLVRALFRLGCVDPRREESLEALAGMLLGCTPRCQVRNKLAKEGREWPERITGRQCVSGTIKALGAFAGVAQERRSPRVQAAVWAGVTFLTGSQGTVKDGPPLLTGPYGCEPRPGPQAHLFGFPTDESTDLLEGLEVLARLGSGPSTAVEAALAIVRRKRGAGGAWPLEYTPENMWADVGRIGQPNKWVTIRALQALQLWSAF